MTSRSAVINGDRGYRRPQFVSVVENYGYSSIFIMPDDLLSVHPFIGKSHTVRGTGDVLEMDDEEVDGTRGSGSEDDTRQFVAFESHEMDVLSFSTGYGQLKKYIIRYHCHI